MIKSIANHRIAGDVFIYIRSAMSNPLSGNEDRHDMVKLEFHHLKRRRVTMAREVADQASIFINLPRFPFSVRRERRLDDPPILRSSLLAPDEA